MPCWQWVSFIISPVLHYRGSASWTLRNREEMTALQRKVSTLLYTRKRARGSHSFRSFLFFHASLATHVRAPQNDVIFCLAQNRTCGRVCVVHVERVSRCWSRYSERSRLAFQGRDYCSAAFVVLCERSRFFVSFSFARQMHNAPWQSWLISRETVSVYMCHVVAVHPSQVWLKLSNG